MLKKILFAALLALGVSTQVHASAATKEMDVQFDQWGKVHCINVGTKCTASVE